MGITHLVLREFRYRIQLMTVVDCRPLLNLLNGSFPCVTVAASYQLLQPDSPERSPAEFFGPLPLLLLSIPPEQRGRIRRLNMMDSESFLEYCVQFGIGH